MEVGEKEAGVGGTKAPRRLLANGYPAREYERDIIPEYESSSIGGVFVQPQRRVLIKAHSS